MKIGFDMSAWNGTIGAIGGVLSILFVVTLVVVWRQKKNRNRDRGRR